MNFDESVQYVENARRIGRDKNDLSVTVELLDRLNNPQHSFKCVHVAGTNGKGSVCAFIESAIRTQGYKTGLFSSPYIHVFNERIQIAGENVDENIFAQVATQVKTIAEDMYNDGYPLAAFFELLTAIAFVIYKEQGVQIAVIETGVGGTYDSTNVITPILSVITSIGYDHMNVLGNTIEEIAQNKAGIIKHNCPVVIMEQKYSEAYAVLLNEAKEKHAPLFSLSKASMYIDAIGFDGANFHFNYDQISAQIKTSMVGYHQVQNASCAFLSLCVLAQYTDVKLSGENILTGIQNAKWIGRMEVLSKNPLMIVDGAHNEQAMASLVKSIQSFIPSGKMNVVFGAMQRKNYSEMAKLLKNISNQIYTVTFDEINGVDAQVLAEELAEEGINSAFIGDIDATIEYVKQQENMPILICGSLYLAGKAREIILNL